MAEKEDITKAETEKIVEEKTKPLFIIMVGIVVVLFIGFISILFTSYTIIQDYLATRAAAFQDLTNKINQQNIKIDLLFEECRQSYPKSNEAIK